MTRDATAAWAVWLQQQHGAYVFPVDHPGLPRCAGWHKPEAPCDGKRGKHPCCRWTQASTREPEAIRAALAAGPRNLGVDTRKSGLLVVDEDQPRAFTRYAASIGEVIPDTFTVATAQGRHLYFRQPDGDQLGNGTGDLSGRGIDIRGAGYVVGPGSLHQTGVMYMPADAAAAIVPAPGWLVAALRAPAPGGRARQPGERIPAAAPAPVRLRGVLAMVLDAQPGERNSRLYWASCRTAEMVAAGELDQATAVRVLTDAGEAIGLGSGETSATISSALREVLA